MALGEFAVGKAESKAVAGKKAEKPQEPPPARDPAGALRSQSSQNLTLESVAWKFDGLLDGLDDIENVRTKGFGEFAKFVKAKLSATKSDDRVKKYNLTMASFDHGDLSIRQARLDIARILAQYLIDERRSHCRAHYSTCQKRDEVCVALASFFPGGRADESNKAAAQDVVAAAILVPDSAKVGEMGDDESLTHMRAVATEYEIPFGAVALRRKILQQAR